VKKRFVAVVEFEDKDGDPMDLSSLATWLDLALLRPTGVAQVRTTAYHSAEAAYLDEISGAEAKRNQVVGARLVECAGGDGSQLCVALKDGTERLLHTYFPKGALLVESELLGKSVAQAQSAD
jgi:hypothetical protein